jgi:hypothetical protein
MNEDFEESRTKKIIKGKYNRKRTPREFNLMDHKTINKIEFKTTEDTIQEENNFDTPSKAY